METTQTYVHVANQPVTTKLHQVASIQKHPVVNIKLSLMLQLVRHLGEEKHGHRIWYTYRFGIHSPGQWYALVSTVIRVATGWPILTSTAAARCTKRLYYIQMACGKFTVPNYLLASCHRL